MIDHEFTYGEVKLGQEIELDVDRQEQSGKNEVDAAALYKEHSDDVTPEKAREVSEKGEEVVAVAERKRGLKKFLSQIKLMTQMLGYYCKGQYKEVPWRTIAGIAGTLAYVLLPVDAVPDVIPFIGYLDDAAVVGMALKFIGDDLKIFEEWLEAQKQLHEER